MQLRQYQTRLVDTSAQLLASGKRKIIAQLATGGGKTVCFSAISHRYTSRNPGQSVLILVHRKELLQQTRRTLYDAFGITAQPIVAGIRHIPRAQVYVGMVESVHRRLSQLQSIGLVIIDEAHIGAFNKLHQHFPDQYIIGFTATPLSASKKDPLKNHYEDIVTGVDIPELIQSGSLCQNITFAPQDVVDRAGLSVKGGEFDAGAMGVAFSKPKYIKNTVTAYEKWAKGTKTIVFNCSVSHSQSVTNAFTLAGYPVKHLDGEMATTERDNIIRWFKTTPDAILCNVGVATTGFDEPTIETVIMNKATTSMPLWLQCTGRGSRLTSSKSAFTIIDMGGNAITHGDWCDSRDWADLFHNPAKPRDKQAVAPIKTCPACEAIIPASATTCKVCGHIIARAIPPEEQALGDFVVVTKNINVRDVIQRHRDKKAYFSFYEIPRTLADLAHRNLPRFTDVEFLSVSAECDRLCADWCDVNHRNYDQWHQEQARDTLIKELSQRMKKWRPPAPDTPPAAVIKLPDFTDYFTRQIPAISL